MRVLVCGGRAFTDVVALFAALDRIQAERGAFTAVIHGAARGADSLGGEYAKARGIAEIAFPADWERLGRAAGPIRNQTMLDEGKPDLVVAFPGGRGTADMAARAESAGVPVLHLLDGTASL